MEKAWLHDVRRRLPSHPALLLGAGDDAAVVRIGAGGAIVATVDLLTDNVDFVLSEVDPRRVGRKALAVNLSDLAAMAARPVAAVVALALPNRASRKLADALYDGLIPLAEEFNVAIAGGDTNTWDGPLVISVTALGEPIDRGVVRRDGVRPGDVILATGSFGGSRLAKHFDFQPRVEAAILLHQRYGLHAAIDVSDGLALDANRLGEASGIGIVLFENSIPINPDAARWAEQLGDGSTALEHALADGEDFELVMAVAPNVAELILAEQPLAVPLSRIGRAVDEIGLWIESSDGRRTVLPPSGWEHGG